MSYHAIISFRRQQQFSPPSSSQPFPVRVWCTLFGFPCTSWTLRHSPATRYWDRSVDCFLLDRVLQTDSPQVAVIPLNTCQNRRNVVRRRPSVLQNVQTQLSRAIYVRMKHLTYELDARRLVRVGFFEMHDKAEGAVFKWCIRRTYNDCIPVCPSAIVLCWHLCSNLQLQRAHLPRGAGVACGVQ